MRKNLISSDTLLPVLNATSLSFSRLFAHKAARGELDQELRRVYGNVEECLKEGVMAASKETSVYQIYLSFARGCLYKAYTEEAAVLGLLAYECAATFKGKQALTGKDWGDGFKAGFLAASSLYEGPILFADESILKEAYQRKIDDLDSLIALFSLPRKESKGSEVFYDFLKASAMGFASPLPLKEESAPFGEMSLTRLEKEGYHLRFLLQCLHSKNKPFDEGEFAFFLKEHSRSYRLEVSNGKVNVQAHVDSPAPILSKSQEYGEFVSFSLRNAYVESFDSRPTYTRNRRPSSKDRALLTYAPTSKCASLFCDLGAELVIDGSNRALLRVEDILLGLRKCTAHNAIFLPTSKKQYVLGKIASRLLYDKNVIVLPCFSLQQAYFGLSNALFEEEGLDALLESLSQGMERIEPYRCEKGELVACLKGIPDIDESEIAFVLTDEAEGEELFDATAAMEELNPYLEIGYLDAGIPHYLIGVAK